MTKFLFLFLFGLLGFLHQCGAQAVLHDRSFTPHYVLEATAADITINCQTRYSVIFNGTSPGPSLYLVEGLTTWVRVYNAIPDQNLTVVSS